MCIANKDRLEIRDGFLFVQILIPERTTQLI